MTEGWGAIAFGVVGAALLFLGVLLLTFASHVAAAGLLLFVLGVVHLVIGGVLHLLRTRRRAG